MTKFVTLTFTRDELADALCATSLLALWPERADRVIEILTKRSSDHTTFVTDVGGKQYSVAEHNRLVATEQRIAHGGHLLTKSVYSETCRDCNPDR